MRTEVDGMLWKLGFSEVEESSLGQASENLMFVGKSCCCSPDRYCLTAIMTPGWLLKHVSM